MLHDFERRPEQQEYDGWGEPAPPELRPIFAGRRELLEWIYQLQYLRGELLSVAHNEHCRKIDVPKVAKLLQGAETVVLHSMPFCPCDCHAREDCPRCENQRWITALDMQMQSADRRS